MVRVECGGDEFAAIADRLAAATGAGAVCGVLTFEGGTPVLHAAAAGVRQASHEDSRGAGAALCAGRALLADLCGGDFAASYARCQPSWMDEASWTKFWTAVAPSVVDEAKASPDGKFAPQVACHAVVRAWGGKTAHVQSVWNGATLTGLHVVPVDRAAYDALQSVESLPTASACTVNDLWHLGSCTKAMTAVLCAQLVDRGELAWQSTLGGILGGVADGVYTGVTLRQLLSHTSGLPANPPEDLWRQVHPLPAGEQRRVFAEAVLREAAPVRAPGPPDSYSNLNYCLAARMAEVASGKPWDELLTERLFVPLGMTSAGIGAAGGSVAALDARARHPWPHKTSDGSLLPIDPRSPEADNPDAIGPAGKVHCTLADWARFAAAHLDPSMAEAKLGLSAATLAVLHEAVEGADHACGWIVGHRDWAAGKTLMHSGSNTMNYCTVWLAPARRVGILAACNACAPTLAAASAAVDESVAALIQCRAML